MLLNGTSQFTDNTLKNSSGNTITLPSAAGTLATTTDLTNQCYSKSAGEALANAVQDIQLGARQAIVFDTVAQMNTWLADSDNTATLAVGHAIFIRATDVPDYWWDGTQALAIEQEKVSLTNYVTMTGTQTLTNKTLTSPTLNNPTITVSGNTLTLPSSGTLATTSDLSGYVTTAKFNKLVNYLKTWINAGNLSMADIESALN